VATSPTTTVLPTTVRSWVTRRWAATPPPEWPSMS